MLCFTFADLCNKVKCKFGAKCENGLCVCPMTCPSTYDPVCASDEQTYKNECEMRMVACSQSIELDAIFNRECDTYDMSGSKFPKWAWSDLTTNRKSPLSRMASADRHQWIFFWNIFIQWCHYFLSLFFYEWNLNTCIFKYWDTKMND